MTRLAFVAIAVLAVIAGTDASRYSPLPKSDHPYWVKQVQKFNKTPTAKIVMKLVSQKISKKTGLVNNVVAYDVKGGETGCVAQFKRNGLKDDPDFLFKVCVGH